MGSAGGFSEDLTDGGGVAFKVVTADRSSSRRDAAKACMAECVSMALQRWSGRW